MDRSRAASPGFWDFPPPMNHGGDRWVGPPPETQLQAPPFIWPQVTLSCRLDLGTRGNLAGAEVGVQLGLVSTPLSLAPVTPCPCPTSVRYWLFGSEHGGT